MQTVKMQISIRDLMRLRKLCKACNKKPSQLVAESIERNHAFYTRTKKKEVCHA